MMASSSRKSVVMQLQPTGLVKKRCGAGIRTYNDGSHARNDKQHNHPNEHRVFALKSIVRDKLKKQVADHPHQKMQDACQEVVNDWVDPDDSSEMHRARAFGKELKTFRGSMYRERMKTLPKLPKKGVNWRN